MRVPDSTAPKPESHPPAQAEPPARAPVKKTAKPSAHKELTVKKPVQPESQWPEFSKKAESVSRPSIIERLRAALAGFTQKLPVNNKPSLPAGKLKYIAPAAAALLVAIVAFLLIRGCGTGSGTAPALPATPVPKGISLLDQKVEDSKHETKVEIWIEIGSDAQESAIESALTEIYEFWRSQRGFVHRRSADRIVIRAYAAQNTFKKDPEWWVGRLYWAEGSKPSYEYNMNALLPRFQAMGYSGLPRNEYLEQSDEIASLLHSKMIELKQLFKSYKEMKINEKQLKEKAVELSEAMYDITTELPEAPWNDCVELDAFFVEMVEDTYFFQNTFTSDSELFTNERLDLDEIDLQIEIYFTDRKSWSSERKKYD